MASGAVSAAHPLAVEAGLALLSEGGNAVDAAIAAQSVLAVVAPQACGLGGDALALVASPWGGVVAVHGAGRAPSALDPGSVTTDGGASVTVPGAVDAWAVLSRRWGRAPLAAALAPAVALAAEGSVVDGPLARAVEEQHARLVRGGAQDWALLRAHAGDRVVQPALAEVLGRIGREGPGAFYSGPLAVAMADAARAHGGALSPADLGAHATQVGEPVATPWAGGRAFVQPPPSQGVLLAMALRWLDRAGPADEHTAVELIEAVFAFRARAGEGSVLLDEPLEVDRERAAHRGGPRGYLHTAGVATADADGLVVSSLVSVFDDFGSCVFVAAGGFPLNDRAAGFTTGANAPRGGAHPVHTLAPALVRRGHEVLALATPGADGQVQTLLQVLMGLRAGRDLPAALAAPRWRAEEGRVLVERSHPALADLRARGHRVDELEDGDPRFGAVVAAGTRGTRPFADADGRRAVMAATR